MLDAERPDVALVDLVMPGATGLDILKRLQGQDSPTAVVMITGHGSIDVAVEAMKTGAVDFLVKPFEMASLERVLQGIEEERQARRMLTRPAAGRDAREAALADAVRRKALLAIVGPDAEPPRGAARVLRIDEEARGPDVFAPSQMYQLNAAIDAFASRTVRPVAYAAGLEPLERVHGREDLKAWIRHTASRCGAQGGLLVVASRDPTLASDLEATSPEAEADPRLQGMLESLANPIRRSIVSYVFGSGPAAYSTILRMNFVDSSSKLSFHLQKLQADGLLTKEGTGAYVLTEEGRRAWRVVRALSDEHRKPTVLFDSA